MRLRNTTTTTGVVESRLPTDEVQEKQIFLRSHHLAPEDFVKNEELVKSRKDIMRIIPRDVHKREQSRTGTEAFKKIFEMNYQEQV